MEAKLLVILFFVFILLVLLYLGRGTIAGAWRGRFLKEHIIVFGLSRIGSQVARNLASGGRRVVLLHEGGHDSNEHLVRMLGGIVISNSGFGETDLRRAGLARASKVIVATDNDERNISIARLIIFLKKRKFGNTSLKLMVHIADRDLKNLIAERMDVGARSLVDLQPFGIDDLTAQYVYDKFPPHLYLVDETEKDAEKIICVVGNDPIARSFIVENSILSQYGGRKPLKVFFINKNAEQCFGSFIREFPHIAGFIDLIPIELVSDKFSAQQSWDPRFTSAVNAIDAAYLFGDSDPKLLNAALHLRQLLYEKTGQIRKVPIVVCLPEETNVLGLLDGDANATGQSTLPERLKEQVVIHLVKKYSDTCSVNNMIDGAGENEVMAKAVNYFYAIKYEFEGLLYTHFRKSGNGEFLRRLEREVLDFKVKRGDPLGQIEHLVVDFTKGYTKNPVAKIRSLMGVERLWNNLTDRKKESNRYVARHLDVKIHILKKAGVKSFGRDEIRAHIDKLAPVEHQRWLAEKLAFDFTSGQLPSGDPNLKKILKDTLKIHDQLIPYNKLDATNKEKDLDMFFLLPLLKKIKENVKE